MKKNKNLPIIIIIIVIILIFLAMALSQGRMILFYSDTCPHCENVDRFIVENNIKDKIKFRELEVSNSKANSQLLYNKAKKCGLYIDDGIGVPFFFDGENCILGDEDIINFLSK